MCIYSLILSYVLRQFELKLGQKSPCEEGENLMDWYFLSVWDIFSVSALVWVFWKQNLTCLFALICKEG